MKKGMIPVVDLANTLNVSPAQITNMRASGILPADIFEKQGRRSYVHEASAMKSLKTAPMGTRGRVPSWVHVVGNKEGIKKLSMAEKASAAPKAPKAAKAAKPAVKTAAKPAVKTAAKPVKAPKKKNITEVAAAA